MRKKQQKDPVLGGRQRAIFAIVLIAVATIIFTTLTQNELHHQSDHQFTSDTAAITQFFINDTASYSTILFSARAFVASSDSVTQKEWDSFFSSQQTFKNSPGVSSVFLLEPVTPAELPTFIKNLDIPAAAKTTYKVSPAGERSEYGLSKLLASPYDLTSTRGFDAFSSSDRKATYDKAARLNEPVASPPLRLATGKSGFFIALPVFGGTGRERPRFVTVSFRTEDFVRELYERTGSDIAVKVSDVTDTKAPVTLFGAPSWNDTPDGQLTKTDKISFGTRNWELEYKAMRSYNTNGYVQFLPYIIMIGGIFLILIVLYSRVRNERVHASLNRPS